MKLLDGKTLSLELQTEIAAEVQAHIANGGRKPHLAAILIGDDPASKAYVGHKVKACAKAGFKSSLIEQKENISQADLLEIVRALNEDDSVDGFIVQLPLPSHIDNQAVIEAVKPSKDVDGFHPENVGRMSLGLPTFLPATPGGIMTLLERNGVKTTGMHAVVIGRSDIVGNPMTSLLSRNAEPGNCTVTQCHSRTVDLKSHTLKADLIIAAVGRPNFVTADMVKEGAVVVDVGINSIEDSSRKSGRRLTGDVDFENVAEKCSLITPVPGGVGPMTIATLLQNTLRARLASKR
ncbi:MAG: bifunctional 5,10-methylenetetrahydrofolate dehydrogenase/5,10-methenyltetrahydrofolate cyclohydrolase [Bacteroidetes bacterium]|jgi:methylenetetrahydrofolate dehydrogenase (NADP+) / methenyltetrahydrofolate cyclohydrolase|nr:bifunctional 5,10-methylenetetrahydrofolate dehydrogenase/5,10-methenyltetrahydrofolate cyclohydrolase [Bacteroidota bacterium]MDA0981075.1 bifunctional 5,10-methylenetetrahydrofolate dehydrogenase/5,10-methenyltetrahydrofolate cyclohydrolase [Bacteroidota bacterium]